MAKPWGKRIRKGLAATGLAVGVPFLDHLFRGVFKSARIATWREGPVTSLREGGKPLLFAYWHRWAIHHLFRFSGGSHITMSSRKDSGELGHRVLIRHGYTTIRGSSGTFSSKGWKDRGGQEALAEMARMLRKTGYDAGLTVDGPHGPPRVVKMGIVLLARETGAPIVPLAVASRPRLVLPTWDGMHIPVPFSRIVYLFGEPLSVPREAAGDGLEACRQELQGRMVVLTAEAEGWFKAAPP